MKKMKCAILAFAAIVGLCTTPIQANADEYISIKSYTEVFTPVNVSNFNILFTPHVPYVKRKYIRNSQPAIYPKTKEQRVSRLFRQELFHFSNIVKAFYWVNSIHLQTFRATYITQKQEKVKRKDI